MILIYISTLLIMDFQDTRRHIFTYLNYGSAYKNGTLVCKQWYFDLITMYPDADVRFANHLATLLKLLPNKPWVYTHLSRNPNIT